MWLYVVVVEQDYDNITVKYLVSYMSPYGEIPLL